MKKFRTYEVTLRRDVQQVARVSVEAASRQEAIDVAESIADEAAWNIEQHLGTHKADVLTARGALRKKPATKKGY